MGTTPQNIKQVPVEKYIDEAISQKNRRVMEVMNALFARLPDNLGDGPDFTLADGTECRIKKFHPPRTNGKDGIVYGFDVTFAPGAPLALLEFSVSCSGFERVY